jgi:hypothetical protein
MSSLYWKAILYYCQLKQDKLQWAIKRFIHKNPYVSIFFDGGTMGFKENLLKKIQIDTLAKDVIASMGAPGSGQRTDREMMVRLLETGPFRSVKERDLDLCILEGDETGGKILVLDNDLAIFHTSVADIALRKSPYIKEMVSIRNIKKILNDTDVVETKKEASVKTIQERCVDTLDLSFTASDIDELVKDGVAAFESGDENGVRQTLTLFADLLDYGAAPRPFPLDRFEMTGKLSHGENSEMLFGPGVIFDPLENRLEWIEVPVGSLDKEKIQHLHKVAKGDETAAAEGVTVFQMLKEAVHGGKE